MLQLGDKKFRGKRLIRVEFLMRKPRLSAIHSAIDDYWLSRPARENILSDDQFFWHADTWRVIDRVRPWRWWAIVRGKQALSVGRSISPFFVDIELKRAPRPRLFRGTNVRTRVKPVPMPKTLIGNQISPIPGIVHSLRRAPCPQTILKPRSSRRVNPQTIHKFAFGWNPDAGQKSALSLSSRGAARWRGFAAERRRARHPRKRDQSSGSCLLIVWGAINKSREEERIRSPFAASDVNATMLVWTRLAPGVGVAEQEGEGGQNRW